MDTGWVRFWAYRPQKREMRPNVKLDRRSGIGRRRKQIPKASGIRSSSPAPLAEEQATIHVEGQEVTPADTFERDSIV